MNSKLLDLRIHGERLWDSLMAMAAIGATAKGGCNRQAMTSEDKAGRDLFTRWCEQAGARVTVDAIGNMFARREGGMPDAPPVMIGSHLDTQITGGKFDGVYGVLSGVEILRLLDEAGIATSHPIEVAVWTNEEGVRFAPAMMGSGVWSGSLDLNEMYQAVDSAGVSLESELRRHGCKGQAPAKARPVKAAFEVHIEQGPILEAQGSQIGVVTGAQGVRWYDLELMGEPCHAGPTPMEMRRDPVAGLLPLLRHCYDLAVRHAPWGRATIGDIRVDPGSRNTVAEKALAKIDMRHPQAAALDQMEQSLRASVAKASESGKLKGSLDEVFRMPVTEFAPECIHAVRQAARRLGYRHMDIVSGAGHDTVNLAAVAPAGMIFVPCEGGISHNEEENARPEDLEAGANVLLQAALSMAG